MMLLTLVENAVKHGINPAVEGGSIRVSARASCGSVSSHQSPDILA
jgi:sensor histidine kinase YesM